MVSFLLKCKLDEIITIIRDDEPFVPNLIIDYWPNALSTECFLIMRFIIATFGGTYNGGKCISIGLSVKKK